MDWHPDRLLPHLAALPPCPRCAAPPFTVHYRPTIDSTNRELWRWLDRGAPSGTVLIAGTQGAGRGQWDRSWQSEPGGLYLSLGLRLQSLAAQEAQRLNFGTAWGLAQILRDSGIAVGLKWPNDLVIRDGMVQGAAGNLAKNAAGNTAENTAGNTAENASLGAIQGRKLGGVLIETRLRGREVSEAVVGVGLNWRNAVPIGGITLQDLDQQQVFGTLETVAAIVLQGLALGYRRWLDPDLSLDRLLPDYLAHCIHLGQKITVTGDSGPQTGTIIGVTAQGCLQVQLGTTLQHYQPGEIQLGYGHPQ